MTLIDFIDNGKIPVGICEFTFKDGRKVTFCPCMCRMQKEIEDWLTKNPGIQDAEITQVNMLDRF